MERGEQREMKRRIIFFLSSPYLTIFLFALGFFPYLAYLVIKGGEAATVSFGIEILLGGTDIPSFIAKNIFARFYFFFFLFHLFFRLYVGFKKDSSLAELKKIDADYIITSSLLYSVVKPKRKWREKMHAFLRDFNFSEEEEKIIAWKRKSPLLKRGWQLGLLIFFLGFLLSILSREAGFVKIGEGEIIERSSPLPSYRYDWLFPEKKVSLPLPFQRVMLQEVDPALDENLSPKKGLIIERPISANLLYEMEGEEGEVKIKVYPPKIFKGYAFLVSEFGLGPRLRIKKSGEVIYDSYFKTEIFPGVQNNDLLQFGNLPFKLSLELEEKKPINLREASYEVRVFKGKEKIAQGKVSPFHPLSFNSYEVSISETRFWVGISIVSDVGLYISIFGFLIFLLFLFLHLFGLIFLGEEEYYFVKERKGRKERIFVGVKTSLFKRWKGRRRFREMIKEIES
jgi:hypothetical protein